MGAIKELMYDLQDLRNKGVDVTSYEDISENAEGDLLTFVREIGPEHWPFQAKGFVSILGVEEDENQCITTTKALRDQLKRSLDISILASQAFNTANPEISNAINHISRDLSELIKAVNEILSLGRKNGN